MNWITLFVTFALIIALASADIKSSSPEQTLGDADQLTTENCPEKPDTEVFTWQQAEHELTSCSHLLLTTKDREEMNEAKSAGRMAISLKRFCSSSAKLRQCLAIVTSTVDPCLTEAERVRKHIVANVSATFLNFICDNDGARITQFCEEESVECVAEHREDINQCVNETIRSDSLADSVLTSEGCKDLRALQRCVVPKLETCSTTTPAEIIDAFINVTYEATPCANLPVLPVGLESQTEVPSDSNTTSDVASETST